MQTPPIGNLCYRPPDRVCYCKETDKDSSGHRSNLVWERIPVGETTRFIFSLLCISEAKGDAYIECSISLHDKSQDIISSRLLIIFGTENCSKIGADAVTTGWKDQNSEGKMICSVFVPGFSADAEYYWGNRELGPIYLKMSYWYDDIERSFREQDSDFYNNECDLEGGCFEDYITAVEVN